MAAPTNTSFVTATDLGLLPATVAQQVDDAGTTYTVYYKFTAAADGVVSAFPFGDLVTYTPQCDPWIGPAASPTRHLSINGNDNNPIQFPVTSGTEYFLQIVKNAGNPSPANLSLTVQQHTDVTVPGGAFCVNDDTVGFQLAILSGASDYTVLKFVLDFPAGEGGDVLTNGVVCVENVDTLTADLFSATYTPIAQVPINDDCRIRTCWDAQNFYVGINANPASFLTVTTTGVATAPVTLTGSTSIRGIAASNDQTILYHSLNANGGAVKRWDIAGGAALSDLVAGIANYRIEDIFVMADDSILVGYAKSTATTDFKVLRYSAAGATLSTYTYGQFDATVTPPRLASALDNPSSFWVMLPRVAPNAGTKTFINTRVSDGSTLTTCLQFLFSAGAAFATATNPPLSFFGSGTSCPFWVTRGTSTGRRGIYVPTRGVAGSEGGGSNARFQDLNGYASTGTASTDGTIGYSATVGGRIIHVQVNGPRGSQVAGGMSGMGVGRAIYVPPNSEGDANVQSSGGGPTE